MAEFDVNRVLADAAYVTVGFGLLGFQRAQVRRHELTKQLEALAGAVDLDRRVDQLEQLLRQFTGLAPRPQGD